MDRETTLRLARESGVWDMLVTYSGEFLDGNPEADCLPELMRLAALIEDHITFSSVHTCSPGCTKPACMAVRKAVEAEREMCAKVCEELRDDWLRGLGRYEFMAEGADYCADAIRSRT